MKRLWFSARRAAAAAINAFEQTVPDVEDLQVSAIDRPDFREGAEVMRSEILRVLTGAPETTDDGCHPVYHQLGVHAPVGNARSVEP